MAIIKPLLCTDHPRYSSCRFFKCGKRQSWVAQYFLGVAQGSSANFISNGQNFWSNGSPPTVDWTDSDLFPRVGLVCQYG
jgi:hypothetical protein